MKVLSENGINGQQRLQKGRISVYTDYQAGTVCEVHQKCKTEASEACKHRITKSKDRTQFCSSIHSG